MEAGFSDAFAAKGTGQPHTARTSKPATRIDYVMALGPIATRLTECRVLFEGAFRLNPDDPTSFALSDHLPVMAIFE
jgi:exonuclease III